MVMRAVVAMVALIVIAALACAPREPAARTPWNETLIAELLRRVSEDQAIRNQMTANLQSGSPPDSLLLARIGAVDSANTAWLRETVGAHGWPAQSTVGREAASAAFLLVQHASRDTAFQAAMLDELVAAFERGEAEGQSVALLTDRVAVRRGQPQVYGTQAGMRDGRLVLEPIADSAGIDARRARMGMIPLRDYVRILDSMYVARPKP
jgi:hypothetical protein